MQIFAALDADLKPVEIDVSAPATTHWYVVQDEADQAWASAPPGAVVPLAQGHAPGAVPQYDAAALARYGVQIVEVADAPEGERRTGYVLSVEAGVITASATFEAAPPPPVPERVSALQLSLALDELGLLDPVENAVAVAPREIKLYWAKTDPFERAHPQIDMLAASIGKTPDDADDVFRLAITKS